MKGLALRSQTSHPTCNSLIKVDHLHEGACGYFRLIAKMIFPLYQRKILNQAVIQHPPLIITKPFYPTANGKEDVINFETQFSFALKLKRVP